MIEKLPAVIGIVGGVIALGAVGDADCGTGSYILARICLGGVMMIGGWAWARLARSVSAGKKEKAAQAGSTAGTATEKNIPTTVYTREGGVVNGLGVHNRRERM